VQSLEKLEMILKRKKGKSGKNKGNEFEKIKSVAIFTRSKFLFHFQRGGARPTQRLLQQLLLIRSIGLLLRMLPGGVL
jgi:hypothetical protein